MEVGRWAATAAWRRVRGVGKHRSMRVGMPLTISPCPSPLKALTFLGNPLLPTFESLSRTAPAVGSVLYLHASLQS